MSEVNFSEKLATKIAFFCKFSSKTKCFFSHLKIHKFFVSLLDTAAIENQHQCPQTPSGLITAF